MKKRILAGTAALAALVVLAFAYMHFTAAPPADLDLARTQTSAAGLYEVMIEPEAEPVVQGTLHSWIATVKLADGAPIEDAVISIDGGMPAHGHGLPTTPQAAPHEGDGRYRIEGVRFNMGGHWVLRLTVSSPAGEDEVAFNILI